MVFGYITGGLFIFTFGLGIRDIGEHGWFSYQTARGNWSSVLDDLKE